MSYPELNVELLDKTLDHIKTLEAFRQEGVIIGDRWDQGTWGRRDECGTAMCFAGWAAQLHGAQFKTAETNCECCVGVSPELVVVDDDGEEHISDYAEDRLGLTLRERLDLFDGGNELVDLESIVANIKDGVYRQEAS